MHHADRQVRKRVFLKIVKFIAAALLLGLLLVAGFSWQMGGQLISAQPAVIPEAPRDLHVESVSIPTNDGQFVSGWWIQGKADKPSVLLLHGVRSNRMAMIGRARSLVARGYSVLLLDLQAHGESPGKVITLGLRESLGVEAGREWILKKNPGRKIGVIGVSLGGASVLLGKMPCGFDAVVLEAVYSNIHRAIRNRLSIRFGRLAPYLVPLLEMQLQPRTGISPEQLAPVDHISQLGAPVLILAGDHDRHTNIDESEEMYRRAKNPKFIWVVPNASHEDFYARIPSQYDEHVIGFLERYLENPGNAITASDIR